MATTTGTVNCISVSENAAFTTIEEAGGDTETFILWFGSTIPPTINSFTRILHSMWLSLLREAHANNLTVRITHSTGSAIVDGVQLGLL